MHQKTFIIDYRIGYELSRGVSLMGFRTLQDMKGKLKPIKQTD